MKEDDANQIDTAMADDVGSVVIRVFDVMGSSGWLIKVRSVDYGKEEI